MLMAMFFYSWGPLGPIIKKEISISNSQFGFLVSAMYLSMTITSVPSGILTDKYGSKAILIGCIILTSCAFTLLAVKSSFIRILIASLLGGIGYGMINQVTIKGLMNWFGKKKRATVLGIKQTSVPIGGSLVAIYIPFFANFASWKGATFLLAIIAFILLILNIIFYIENPVLQHIESSKNLANTDKNLAIYLIITKPLFIFIVLLSALMAICQASFSSFLVIYVIEKYYFSELVAGICLTIALVGGILSRVVFGYLSDRVLSCDRLIPLAMLAFIGTLSSIFLILMPQSVSSWIMYLVSALLGAAFIGWNALFITLIAEIAGYEIVGSVIGIVLTLIWAGMMVGPMVFGIVVDTLDYYIAWMMVSLLSFISGSGFFFIRRYYYDYIYTENKV
ncbi:MAG: MFS transporter [Desulfovermiculus sp.]|nr:MFS transporter [Desulfovermiculus sp.]